MGLFTAAFGELTHRLGSTEFLSMARGPPPRASPCARSHQRPGGLSGPRSQADAADCAADCRAAGWQVLAGSSALLSLSVGLAWLALLYADRFDAVGL